ncbi:hypothetical protein FDECE_9040 [Fusarium decemcellulare]|nr:hypothetical protein FDECE_9040 [Fusarium decemcellulare]
MAVTRRSGRVSRSSQARLAPEGRTRRSRAQATAGDIRVHGTGRSRSGGVARGHGRSRRVAASEARGPAMPQPDIQEELTSSLTQEEPWTREPQSTLRSNALHHTSEPQSAELQLDSQQRDAENASVNTQSDLPPIDEHTQHDTDATRSSSRYPDLAAPTQGGLQSPPNRCGDSSSSDPTGRAAGDGEHVAMILPIANCRYLPLDLIHNDMPSAFLSWLEQVDETMREQVRRRAETSNRSRHLANNGTKDHAAAAARIEELETQADEAKRILANLSTDENQHLDLLGSLEPFAQSADWAQPYHAARAACLQGLDDVKARKARTKAQLDDLRLEWNQTTQQLAWCNDCNSRQTQTCMILLRMEISVLARNEGPLETLEDVCLEQGGVWDSKGEEHPVGSHINAETEQ